MLVTVHALRSFPTLATPLLPHCLVSPLCILCTCCRQDSLSLLDDVKHHVQWLAIGESSTAETLFAVHAQRLLRLWLSICAISCCCAAHMAWSPQAHCKVPSSSLQAFPGGANNLGQHGTEQQQQQ